VRQSFRNNASARLGFTRFALHGGRFAGRVRGSKVRNGQLGGWSSKVGFPRTVHSVYFRLRAWGILGISRPQHPSSSPGIGLVSPIPLMTVFRNGLIEKIMLRARRPDWETSIKPSAL
jgi:hypothetical protein